MTFNADQIKALTAPLDRSHVAERQQAGRKLSYIEGWHAIAEANRIFGFDGWNRETVELREVRPCEIVKNNYGKETWRVGYLAKVRVTVGSIVREGTGFGSGAMPDLGDAIESAIKEAETDAMKRALMTFGNPFGLALYDKTQANVANGTEEQKPSPVNSSASLKRDGEWERVKEEIDRDLLDCRSIPALEKLKDYYRERAKASGWPRAWMEALAEIFEAHAASLNNVLLAG